MIWLALAAVVLGLVWFFNRRGRRDGSDHELGKGHGNAGRDRYKNRSSRHRDLDD